MNRMERCGLSDKQILPSFIPYSAIPDLDQCPAIGGTFCYIVRGYKPGFSILINRDDSNIAVRAGGWDGVVYDLKDSKNPASKYVSSNAFKLSELLMQIRLPQAQLYISECGKLVDVRVSLNKLVGPGMLRDLFSNVVPIQDVVGIEVLTPDKIEDIKKGDGQYAGGLIFKPSKYRTGADQITPLYAKIRI